MLKISRIALFFIVCVFFCVSSSGAETKSTQSTGSDTTSDVKNGAPTQSSESATTPEKVEKKPGAKDIKPKDSGPQEPPPDSRKKYGEWWMRSPLSYDPMPTEFLYHIEGQYNYSQSEGNFTRDNHMIESMLVLRKNRYTNYLKYTFEKKHACKPDDWIGIDSKGNFYIDEKDRELRDTTMQQFEDSVRIALTKRWYLAPGFRWTEDDYLSIKGRYTYYGGVGFRALNEIPFFLTLFAAYGYEEIEYTDDYNSMGWLAKSLGLIDYFEEGKIRSDKYLLGQYGTWFVTKSLMFDESFEIIGDMEKRDDDKWVWRWTLQCGLKYKLGDYAFLNVKFVESFDKAPMVMARKRDQSTYIGIQFSY